MLESVLNLQKGMKFVVASEKKGKSKWNMDGFMDELMGTVQVVEKVEFSQSMGTVVMIESNGPWNGYWSFNRDMIDWEKTNILNNPLPKHYERYAEMLGYVDVYVDEGKKTIVARHGNIRAKAKCGPEDKWDESYGVVLAVIRLQEKVIQRNLKEHLEG